MIGVIAKILILLMLCSKCLCINESFNNCKDDGGIVLDQELCIPKDYKKASIPWTEDSNPFQINISIALTSLVKVSLESNSFSFYLASIGEWRDPR